MSQQPRPDSFCGCERTVRGVPIRVSRVQPFLSALEGERGVSIRTIRRIISARSKRAEYFGSSLFADPAWDMLLALYGAEIDQRRVSVGNLCCAARVPASTALRWIDVLVQHRLVAKRSDPFHGRRVHISLTPQGSLAMEKYFTAMPEAPAVL